MAAMFVRALQHLSTGKSALRRRFDAAAMARIRDAIVAAEHGHVGEIRFAVEAMLPLHDHARHRDARSRAIEAFSLLRVWDTEANTGVLLYLLWADRAVEIVVDRGIARVISSDAWQVPCDLLARRLGQGDDVAEAVCECIAGIGAILRDALPATGDGRDELSDTPVIL